MRLLRNLILTFVLVGCSVQGIFKSLDISKASVHDIHYFKDIKTQLFDGVLLGDKGYLSHEHQLDLLETAKIKLETPMRKNQHDYKKNLTYLERLVKE